MSKEQVLKQIRDALNDVPVEHRAEVSKAIVHDIGVMARAISIADKQPD